MLNKTPYILFARAFRKITHFSSFYLNFLFVFSGAPNAESNFVISKILNCKIHVTVKASLGYNIFEFSIEFQIGFMYSKL